jgi:hypothetical protein
MMCLRHLQKIKAQEDARRKAVLQRRDQALAAMWKLPKPIQSKWTETSLTVTIDRNNKLGGEVSLLLTCLPRLHLVQLAITAPRPANAC